MPVPLWLDYCFNSRVVAHEVSDRFTPPPDANSPVVAGQVIGERYLIGSVIGEGGMGIVCAATHLGLGTQVAIKLIRSDLKHDHESVQRFLNEARTAASLKGEHIARVYDVGQLESGEPYLVMEQLEGIPLDVFIEERAPLSPSDAVDIVLQACEGLAEAHAVALVHRDIKPANLFLARRPDGQFILKILDFGIAKRLIEGTRRGLTDPGRSIGSPWYMSPEQMMNASLVDQRADVWSLGVLLFELLTNEYPFDGEGVVQVCANVLTVPSPSPSSLRPDTDPDLDAIVLHCLEKKPEDRYGSVTELAEALRPFGSRPVLPSVQPASPLAPSHALIVSSSTPLPAQGRGTATTGRITAAPKPGRTFGSTLAIALFSLLIGAVISWFGWPYVHAHYGLLPWERIARTRLPWDPVLAPGPSDEGLHREGESVGLAPTLLISSSGPHGARTQGPEAALATPAVKLNPEEVRRRTARYESWLRTQGLTRLNAAPVQDGSAPPSLPDDGKSLPDDGKSIPDDGKAPDDQQ